MIPVTYEITVGRSYDYQKVEITAKTATPLTDEGADSLRKSVALLADEALRELTISQNLKKERDDYYNQISNLENQISEFPVIESGHNFGQIDVANLDARQKALLSRYKRLRELHANTAPYNYGSVPERYEFTAPEKN